MRLFFPSFLYLFSKYVFPIGQPHQHRPSRRRLRPELGPLGLQPQRDRGRGYRREVGPGPEDGVRGGGGARALLAGAERADAQRAQGGQWGRGEKLVHLC